MRGRNRNKGPNPLTRTYESNGPDVKIRGTAQHIADKYAQLARDAQASGDPVAAENYLQHAEHYYRIIAAAQEQFRDQFGAFQRPFDEDGDEDAAPGMNGHGYAQGERFAGPQSGGDDADPGMQPQPFEGRGGNGEQRPRFNRGDRQERRDQFGRQDRGERRDRFPRNEQPRQDFQRDEQRQEFNREDRRRRDEGDEQANGLPAFLTNPVRQQPISLDEEQNGERAAPEVAAEEAGESNGRYGSRPRRRRRRYGNGQGDEGANETGTDFGPENAEPSE
jgi:hypothetical protein